MHKITMSTGRLLPKALFLKQVVSVCVCPFHYNAHCVRPFGFLADSWRSTDSLAWTQRRTLWRQLTNLALAAKCASHALKASSGRKDWLFRKETFAIERPSSLSWMKPEMDLLQLHKLLLFVVCDSLFGWKLWDLMSGNSEFGAWKLSDWMSGKEQSFLMHVNSEFGTYSKI